MDNKRETNPERTQLERGNQPSNQPTDLTQKVPKNVFRTQWRNLNWENLFLCNIVKRFSSDNIIMAAENGKARY